MENRFDPAKPSRSLLHCQPELAGASSEIDIVIGLGQVRPALHASVCPQLQVWGERRMEELTVIDMPRVLRYHRDR